MPDPVVSIFVQAYKTERFIKRCLESVLSLEGNYDYEVLVIDDASPDCTWDVLSTFKDKRLRLVRHERNLGANATANEGYAWGTGRYIARLDSDDVYKPNFLSTLVPLLESNPRVGLAYGDIALADANDRITSPRGNVLRAGRAPIGDEFFPLCERNFIPAPATLVRREALSPLMPIPKEYSFLDWYISTGVAERWHTAFADSVVAEYRVHDAGAHRVMVRDRSGEQITFSVLDGLWSNGYRAEEKANRRGRVYGANYLTCAENYFSSGDYAAARQCYRMAALHDLSLVTNAGVLRRWFGTHLGPRVYEGTKHLVRRVCL